VISRKPGSPANRGKSIHKQNRKRMNRDFFHGVLQRVIRVNAVYRTKIFGCLKTGTLSLWPEMPEISGISGVSNPESIFLSCTQRSDII